MHSLWHRSVFEEKCWFLNFVGRSLLHSQVMRYPLKRRGCFCSRYCRFLAVLPVVTPPVRVHRLDLVFVSSRDSIKPRSLCVGDRLRPVPLIPAVNRVTWVLGVKNLVRPRLSGPKWSLDMQPRPTLRWHRDFEGFLWILRVNQSYTVCDKEA